MANYDGSVTIEIKAELDQLKDGLKEANTSIKNFSDEVEKKTNVISNSFEQSEENINRLKASTVALGYVAGKALVKLTQVSVDFLKTSFLVGKEYESAFAGVVKTVNATDEQLQVLKKDLVDMSKVMPKTASGLASIAESAGQLGIRTENLKDFVETMAQLDDATNLSSEEGSSQLAKIANITQMDQRNFSRLGSSIVALGNNFATTERDIVEMTLNLAGAAKQANFSEAEMLALSASLSSVGIEAQAGGTSVSTLLLEMKRATIEGGKDLETFAKTANMTSDEFKVAFEKNAAQAFNQFIKGLSTAKERGQDAILLLNEMGINESRMTRALLSLSSASDVLNNALGVSNDAWSANVALSKEASQRYETLDSKLQMTSNNIASLGIEMYDNFQEPLKEGLVDVNKGIDDLGRTLRSPEMKSAVKSLTKDISGFLKTSISLGSKALPGVIKSFSTLIALAPKALVFFTTYTAVQKTVTSYIALKKAMTAAGSASKLLTASLQANPAILAATAAAVAVTAIYAVVSSVQDANKEVKELNKSYKELNDSFYENDRALAPQVNTWERLGAELKNMVDVDGNLVGSKEELIKKINEFNQSVGTTLLQYDEETGKIINQKGEVVNLQTELEKLIDLKKAEAWLDAHKDDYIKALEEKRKAMDLIIEKQKEINEAIKQRDSYEENSANYRIKDNHIANLNEDMERLVETAKPFQEMISNYEAMGKALNDMDTDKIDLLSMGLSASQLNESSSAIRALKEELEKLKEQRELLNQIDSSLVSEEQKTQLDNDIKKLEEQIQKVGSGSKDSLEKPITESAQRAVNQAQSLWNNFNLAIKRASIVVDVKYNDAGAPSGHRSAYRAGGATYLDSEGAVYDHYFNKVYDSLANFIAPRQSMNFAVGYPGTSSNVTLNQTNNFNQPIENPSDVNSSIERVNRELAKRVK
ncbi:phage tail tape measure protein [Erysipelotrichaceae bacterium OH741_COT-311]|nr:phage tail tape measure protein [Erysipelotrichaceae bacterium OH741_COT-311]